MNTKTEKPKYFGPETEKPIEKIAKTAKPEIPMPPSTNKHDLRGSCKLDQPTYSSRFIHRSYQYVTTRLWNNLSDFVRRAPSLDTFKSMLDEVNLTIRLSVIVTFVHSLIYL